MRSECIGLVDTTKSNLRVDSLRQGAGSVHQRFITIFAQTDRRPGTIKKNKIPMQDLQKNKLLFFSIGDQHDQKIR